MRGHSNRFRIDTFSMDSRIFDSFPTVANFFYSISVTSFIVNGIIENFRHECPKRYFDCQQSGIFVSLFYFTKPFNPMFSVKNPRAFFFFDIFPLYAFASFKFRCYDLRESWRSLCVLQSSIASLRSFSRPLQLFHRLIYLFIFLSKQYAQKKLLNDALLAYLFVFLVITILKFDSVVLERSTLAF